MSIRDTQDCLLFEVPTLGTSHLRDTQDCLLFEMPVPPVSLTYPLTPPAISGIGPQDFTMDLQNIIGEADSPFTASDQVQFWPGDMFTIEATMPPMLLQQAEQWISFLNALYGKYGTFLMGDYNRPTPQGPMSGSPVVNGAQASGSTQLNIRGASPSLPNWAVAGDYVQVTAVGGQQRIHKVLLNAPSSSGGIVSLYIRPSIRESLTDGLTVVTQNCAGTFRLSENKSPSKVDKNRIYTISFKAREALLP